MSAPAQRLELRARRRSVRGFGKALGAECQRLIGADDEAARQTNCDLAGFFPCEQGCDLARACGWHSGFDRTLVDVGRADLDRNTCGLQQRVSDRAF
jgi:hypothetical protein